MKTEILIIIMLFFLINLLFMKNDFNGRWRERREMSRRQWSLFDKSMPINMHCNSRHNNSRKYFKECYLNFLFLFSSLSFLLLYNTFNCTNWQELTVQKVRQRLSSSVDTPSRCCFKVEGKPVGIFRFKLKKYPQKRLINIEQKIQTLVNISLSTTVHLFVF